MKDPIGVLVAVLFTAFGGWCLFFTRWAYRVVTPEQAARDHKRFKILGAIMFPLGLILLILRLVYGV
jgi:formate/nitrite transporter FocA (FNT family)